MDIHLKPVNPKSGLLSGSDKVKVIYEQPLKVGETSYLYTVWIRGTEQKVDCVINRLQERVTSLLKHCFYLVSYPDCFHRRNIITLKQWLVLWAPFDWILEK